jgi:KDO2-lipid IV(A) lauroyltransferase
LPRGAGYTITLRPFPAARPHESPTRLLNRALEELVRECPEQYLWGYNRYKVPAGAKPRPA